MLYRRASLFAGFVLPLATLAAPASGTLAGPYHMERAQVAAIEKRLFAFPGDNKLEPSPSAFVPSFGSAKDDADLSDYEMALIKRAPSFEFAAQAEANYKLIQDKHGRKRSVKSKNQQRAVAACLPAGATDVDINNAFSAGGAGTKVQLCPGTTYYLNDTIYMMSNNQELSTIGYPTGSTRATLVVNGANQVCALYTASTGVSIKNVQFNGNRPALGIVWNGPALLELGGPGQQTVSNVVAYETRGWSCMHIAEGNNDCAGMSIVNNQVGPSGDSPNSSKQYHRVMDGLKERLRRRSSTFEERDSSIAPGQWADGISLSCASSIVQNNVVTDATDGAIVIFGSPGSTISGNTVISQNRVGLGGINMVDWNPWSGTFSGVMVKSNTIITQGSMIKVGIAVGPLVWGSNNYSQYYTHDGKVQSNSLQSTNGYFGYGIAVAGHTNAYIQGNDFSQARFNGAPSSACLSGWMPPAPQPLTKDMWTTSGSFQSGFSQWSLAFLICMMPCEYSDAGCTWNGNMGPAGATNYGSTSPGMATVTSSSASSSTSTSVLTTSTTSSTTTSTTSSTTSVQTTSRAPTTSPTTASTTAVATPTSTSKSTKVTSSSSTKSSSTSSKKPTGSPKPPAKKKVDKSAKHTTVNGWLPVKVVENFVDDRPPFTSDSDAALVKGEADYVVPEEPFTFGTNLPDGKVERRGPAPAGFGRNVYERDHLVEAGFLVDVE